MKAFPLVLVVVMAAAASVYSQEVESPTSEALSTATGAPAAPSAVIHTTSRILGNIPDGTPPPPAPPKPRFIIPQTEVLASKTHQQGGRTITIQKIKPIALPPLPEPETAMLASAEDIAAFKMRVAAYRETHPWSRLLFLGATVYRFQNAPPRTLVSYWPGDGAASIQLWSSADFSLVSGIHSFVGNDGGTHSLCMMWSVMYPSGIAGRMAAHGREYHAPVIPTFPAGPATFTWVGTPPAPEIVADVQSLHDIYNTDHERLKTAWEGRVRAQIAREAELKAHPPQPKDIVINFWRTDKPATVKGESK